MLNLINLKFNLKFIFVNLYELFIVNKLNFYEFSYLNFNMNFFFSSEGFAFEKVEKLSLY